MLIIAPIVNPVTTAQSVNMSASQAAGTSFVIRTMVIV